MPRPHWREPHHGGRRAVSGLSTAAGVVVLVLLVALAVVRAAPPDRPDARGPGEGGGAGAAAGRAAAVVGASLPVWGSATGSAAVAQHAAAFTTASPQLYEMTADGGVALRGGLDPVAARAEVARLHRAGVDVLPAVTNTRDGSWDTALAQRVLHDPDLRDRHVVALVDLVLREDVAGVDVDYEELTAADRTAFSAFLARLGPALRAHGRLLAVDVFAKDGDAGYDQRNLAQDYAAIGRAADQVRVMAYDWHWETSPAGPVAPLDWVQRVVAYAVTQVPRERLVLGVPTYGYDWAGPAGLHQGQHQGLQQGQQQGQPAGQEGRRGELASWAQAHVRAADRGAPVRWDAQAQSPWLAYTDASGGQHELWFEDGRSTAAKLALARSERLGGVYLWLVGDVDPGTWPLLEALRRGDALVCAPLAAQDGGAA
ncbi:peptidoglycan hydrolase [Streptomyces sp. NP160]|uniref:glycosyl hydrolase family 18 protein n=1 Tax=Streptomyces sp. NP160 TaxID=2586637 RepID=UPI0011197562|nr:glycosyl hydrolase family 18 protein [Streptomyces sp. NP160]TNM70297.1 peptidoglycan hydrolase [Streptomyces sp. NP160]